MNRKGENGERFIGGMKKVLSKVEKFRNSSIITCAGIKKGAHWLRYEVCKQHLDAHVNMQPTHFSYPHTHTEYVHDPLP